MDYHKDLQCCTPEEGVALKKAGYTRKGGAGDLYWDGKEVWVITGRFHDWLHMEVYAQSGGRDITAVREDRLDFTRLPRLQELLAFHIGQAAPGARIQLTVSQDNDPLAITARWVLDDLTRRQGAPPLSEVETRLLFTGPEWPPQTVVPPVVPKPMRWEYRQIGMQGANISKQLTECANLGWELVKIEEPGSSQYQTFWRRSVPTE